MTARLLTNISTDAYYADPCRVPSLSQSMARTLIMESPLHAWHKHPRLGNGQPHDMTKAKTNGQLIHKFLLDEGGNFEVIDAPDFKSKAAREERDRAIAAGKTPVIASVYAEVKAVALVLKDKLAARGYFFNGQSEVAIEWEEQGAFGPVLCRCLMDHVFFDAGVIYDVKTIRSADPRTASRHGYEYGYDIQAAAYKRALEALKPELAGKVQFIDLFVETDPPYVITPARMSEQYDDIGQLRWGRAVLLWEKCLRDNNWPEYTDSIIDLEPPQWVVNEEISNETEIGYA